MSQGFEWSIGESNPCSAKNMVATPHCGAHFLFFEAGTDEISATGGHQFLPLSNAFSAISKSGMRTLRARINKSGHPRRVSGLFVEHRGVEPLTSTMRMSRATNCANAPYIFSRTDAGGVSRVYRLRVWRRCGLSTADGSISQLEGKGKIIFWRGGIPERL